MIYSATFIIADILVIWVASNYFAIIYLPGFDTKINSFALSKTIKLKFNKLK
jgi:hypothetical protein